MTRRKSRSKVNTTIDFDKASLDNLLNLDEDIKDNTSHPE